MSHRSPLDIKTLSESLRNGALFVLAWVVWVECFYGGMGGVLGCGAFAWVAC